MARQLYDAQGQPVALPTSLADAKRHRYAHFDCGDECAECVSRGHSGVISRKRYTANGQCVHCASMAALELQSLASFVASLNLRSDGTSEYLLNHQPIEGGREVTREYCDHLEAALDLVGPPLPTTREGAMAAGTALYIRDTPCRTHGHLGVRTLSGDCYYCAEEKARPSPRQEAIRNGDKWYVPNTACERCGQRAEKRVDNGQCRGCQGGREGSVEAELMVQHPDLILSRSDAKAAGLKVYRTGDECRAGHRGFRYTSTAGCIKCLRS